MPLVINESGPSRHVVSLRGDAMAAGCVAIFLCCSSCVCAQLLPATPGLPQPAQATSAACTTPPVITNTTSAPAPKPVGAAAAPGDETPHIPYPTEAATQPARVTVRDGKLTVEASNSDLPQILNQVATMSGITIRGIDGKGINGGARVFGVYGPGQPRVVLAALLSGSGYNFIMVGGSGDGAPRELLLTARNKSDAAPVISAPVAQPPDEAEESEQTEIAPTSGAAPPAKPETDEEGVQRTLQRLKVLHDHPEAPPE
jgi:hypothetical protein